MHKPENDFPDPVPAPENDRYGNHRVESEEERLGKPEELKDKYAFALTIDQVTGMPKVTAMGRGLIARKIEQKGREAGLRVEKDPDMTRRLFKPADDRAIPTRIYGVIAEILTFVYELNELFDKEEIPPEEEDEETETGETADLQATGDTEDLDDEDLDDMEEINHISPDEDYEEAVEEEIEEYEDNFEDENL